MRRNGSPLVKRRMEGQICVSPDYALVPREKTPEFKTKVEQAIKSFFPNGIDTLATSTGKEAPALLIDPPLDIQAMQEEIFGPILPINPYETVEEAMAFVAERAPPLALDIFTEKYAERDTWLKKSLSGGVCVNETLFHVAAATMPFGALVNLVWVHTMARLSLTRSAI